MNQKNLNEKESQEEHGVDLLPHPNHNPANM